MKKKYAPGSDITMPEIINIPFASNKKLEKNTPRPNPKINLAAVHKISTAGGIFLILFNNFTAYPPFKIFP